MLGLHNIPYVAKNLFKNLANRTSRGKNFRGVFLDVFRYPEFESAIRIAIFSADHKILNLLCLSVRDCITKMGCLIISEVSMMPNTGMRACLDHDIGQCVSQL